jgi:hypothetical protein
MKTNKICMTCGKKYYYCPNCEEMKNYPYWMSCWHDKNCKDIFEILGFYVDNIYSKEQAKEKLEACNLNNTFPIKIQNIINEIIE